MENIFSNGRGVGESQLFIDRGNKILLNSIAYMQVKSGAMSAIERITKKFQPHPKRTQREANGKGKCGEFKVAVGGCIASVRGTCNTYCNIKKNKK